MVWMRRAVHPRACGEHHFRARLLHLLTGSSPRLRGTHGCRGVGRDINRFIPAPAGNTLQEHRRVMGTGVHPRACGEHTE